MKEKSDIIMILQALRHCVGSYTIDENSSLYRGTIVTVRSILRNCTSINTDDLDGIVDISVNNPKDILIEEYKQLRTLLFNKIDNKLKELQ